MQLQSATVAFWRKRFLAGGIAALGDQPRAGKPPTYNKVDLRTRLLKQLELPPPHGLASWDGGTLAHALNVSDDAIWRILRKEGIQLQRMRSWCVSTDPEFSAKAANVIGLYLDPPHNAIVISVDEKPSIQAIERKRGYVQTSSGKVVRGASFARAKNRSWLSRFRELQQKMQPRLYGGSVRLKGRSPEILLSIYAIKY